MNDITCINVLNFSTERLLVWSYLHGWNRRISDTPSHLKNFLNNEVKGVLSSASEKKLKKYIHQYITCFEVYAHSTKKKQNWVSSQIKFITLTLSAKQMHDDDFIRRNMLEYMITKLKRKNNLKNYIYCSEAQENGNIHFHLIVDKYINYEDLRNYWNEIQALHGYIDIFEKKFKHRNPNSTDIHKLDKINSISFYLAKYFTKTENRRKILGRLYGCSDSVRNIRPLSIDFDREIIDMLHNFEDNSKIKTIHKEHFSLYKYCQLSDIQKNAKTFYKNIVAHYTTEYNLLME